MAEEGYKVSLNVYDLSQGMARQLSQTFLGKVIEGIWHTGVVVYGTEYYFGQGIQHAPVESTPYGKPISIVELGFTHVPKELFEEYLQEIGPRYTAETYSLLKHNCNNFSNEVAQFLVGIDIPAYILQLPNDVINSPMGGLILPMIQQLEVTMRSGAAPRVPQFIPTSVSQPSPFMSTTINSNTDKSTTTTSSLKPAPSNGTNTCSTKISGKPVVNSREISNKANVSDDRKTNVSESTRGAPKKVVDGVAGDPLGNARSKIQEEIGQEFAAIMASGAVGASEAATLATRKVMEKYGMMNLAVQQN